MNSNVNSFTKHFFLKTVIIELIFKKLLIGWTPKEHENLRLALMYFGVGRWSKIIEKGVLPGKTNAQLYLQTQRMLGQQSLGGKF